MSAVTEGTHPGGGYCEWLAAEEEDAARADQLEAQAAEQEEQHGSE